MMYTVIRRYVDEAFDATSEESGKKTLSFRNCYGLFQACLSRPKNMGSYRPRRGNPGYTSKPHRE